MCLPIARVKSTYKLSKVICFCGEFSRQNYFKMPQKGYIMNKKSLPKLETPEDHSDDEIDEEIEDEELEDEEIEDEGIEDENENEVVDEIEDESENEVEEETVETQPEVAKEEKFSLYVRSAAWLKDRDNAVNLLKEIEPRIQNVRHPRQKSADYCFIDFATAVERDEAYESMKNHSKLTVKPVIKDVPSKLNKRKTKIAEKREAKKETRKLLAKIKKNEKQNSNAEKTNQLIITNLPKQTTVAELKEHFSTSVKINLKMKNKIQKFNTAIIMFPSPSDAIAASKESVLLHGQKVNAILNTNVSFKEHLKSERKRKGPTNQSDGEPIPKSTKNKAK